jgi:hypothetical protein
VVLQAGVDDFLPAPDGTAFSRSSSHLTNSGKTADPLDHELNNRDESNGANCRCEFRFSRFIFLIRILFPPLNISITATLRVDTRG